jgi:hypothetical protein
MYDQRSYILTTSPQVLFLQIKTAVKMYDQRSRLAALLLKEMFGPLVGRVGADLLGFGTKTFGQITATTGQFQ